ncbi:MAG: acetoacetate--CoA ligase [Gemmatimonadota bacterium]|nr:acetoacetate--CoA ligase [Gemmatimonadota bacterium]
MSEAPLWAPDAGFAAATPLASFTEYVNDRRGVGASEYGTLWRWSVEEKVDFWNAVWDFCGVIGEKGERTLVDGHLLPGARFFPDAGLNFAENLLKRRDAGLAMMARREDGLARDLSWAELYDLTSRLAFALRSHGLRAGDRVAAYIPNIPEAMITMLAGSSLGATISTASPDFGVQGVLDRFGQIEPRVLVAADGYLYNGVRHSSLEKLPGILAGLPTVERVVIVPYLDDGQDPWAVGPGAPSAPDLDGIRDAVLLSEFVRDHPPGEIEFTRLPFDQPIYIQYSSGTTGAPKCIVHRQGGILLQHFKEHRLHNDIRPDDRVFYFTTTGWMMWNWLASVLGSSATVVLYDGSPAHPDLNVAFDLMDETRMTLFGTSPKFLDSCAKAGLRPMDTHDLSSLRMLCSAGSPLLPEGFEYVYANVKRDVQVASISGGTDLCASFVSSNAMLPVWPAEIQCRSLGMDVDVFDDEGRSLLGPDGTASGKGELVCKSTFPSVPLEFWGDEDGSKLQAAYFDTYPGVWHHGDYVQITEHGGMIIFGRSDATLNPGGVRIGTSEIYRQVERLPEIEEAVVIGQEWDGDTRVVLFVRLVEGAVLDAELEARIRHGVRENTTSRHVPKKIIEVEDIPRTKSGKVVELAVRSIVHGRPIKNIEALANPEAIALFENLPELAL